MPHYLLAHDLGTSGNKATLYTHGGQAGGEPHLLLSAPATSTATGRNRIPKTGGGPSASPRGSCWSRPGRAAEIAVVALSGQMMGCTPVDGEGNALRPSILYCDQRATEQATRFCRGSARVVSIASLAIGSARLTRWKS